MKQIDKIAAETKSIGFDYQYYFFLWKLLSLKTEESIGLEVKDDIHIELSSGNQIYYQIKHTTQKNVKGSSINLTELDKDLWKTLSNWVGVISDKYDDREDKRQQLNFLKKTDFILASNKSSKNSNRVLVVISNLQNDKDNIDDIKSFFQDLINKTEDSVIKKYISNVLILHEDVLKIFLSQITFELDENDIIQKCKDAIRAKMFPENKIDDLYFKIDSAIRRDNFINIKAGKKIEIKFEEFYKKYKRYFTLERNGSLQIKEFTKEEYTRSLPKRLEDQIFIKQILEIGDIKSNDLESVAEFSRFKIKLKNNIMKWEQSGELTREEIKRFEVDAIARWKNIFRKFHRGDNKESDNKKGQYVLDSVRENHLKIAEQELETDMSNGTFYNLSDKPKIGWREDWEKYSK